MTGNEAVNLILDPRTPEETRRHLRERVHRVFDEMYEEAAGQRPRRNQGVWDALERWKRTGGVIRGKRIRSVSAVAR